MVVPEHETFARAVVALAREHKMNGVTLSFRRSFGGMSSQGPYEEVTMRWSEGRHGGKANITFETRGRHEINEDVPCS